MKFLLISESGDGIGMAIRLKDEGNEVACIIKDDDCAQAGDGLVEKIQNWQFDLDTDTIIVADCTGSGVLLDALRSSGYSVCGGSHIADRLECDRLYAAQVMKDCGIKVPESKHFDSYEDAETGIEEGKCVFKPEGDLSGSVPSYVCDSTEELHEVLQQAKAAHPKSKIEFTIQEFIEGTCVSTECWFDGHDFVKGMFNHTIERKHLMNGDIGPSGGCTGNLVWADDSALIQETVLKLRNYLKDIEYRGAIDINAVVTEDEVYGLEFTPRFGYDATPTLLWELLDSDIGKLFSDIATHGRSNVGLRSGFAGGVRLSIPPWPSEQFHAPEGLLVDVKHSMLEHFYPFQVAMYEKELRTIGAGGIIGIATAYNNNASEALESATKLAKKIKVPNKQYRTDLSEVIVKDLRKLRSVEAGVGT